MSSERFFDDIKAVNEKALLALAQDECSYCGGRAAAFYSNVDGPDDTGHFTHQHRTDKEARALCKASTIHARLHAAREAAKS